MRIYHSIDQLPEFSKTVFTQGTFDGVHLGHQKILASMRELAERAGGETLLLTFWPHPRLLLYPEDNQLKLLQTLEEKLQVLRACGLDNVIVLPFTKEFSNILPEDYIKDFLVNRLNIHTAIVGYDHRFGRNREWDIVMLKSFAEEFNYEVKEIGAEEVDEIAVSSTKIRHALMNGEADTANNYLGRPYTFSGLVVKGMQLGRQLGFPTANLEPESRFKLIPANGVYAVMVKLEDTIFKGMMNIGYNPTVVGKTFSIEVNIFDFDGDIYNRSLEISVISRIRDEIKFDSLDELALILRKDKEHALEKLTDL